MLVDADLSAELAEKAPGCFQLSEIWKAARSCLLGEV